ncbi:laccase [Tricholoma furcatifolium]|nr:laccase [Tricholoma furcatifolium]
MAALTLGPQSNMYIVNEYIAPDGFNRSAVLAATATNASFPGPLITANKGDNFQINVIDQLTDTTMLTSTSIHWHGFFQKNSSWADGPAFVNQCPIAPGYSFLYDFSIPDQAGTFWYHSHLSTQYCDGLRGPIVVYDPNDPYLSMYDVDDETTVITLADWYHTPAPSAGLVPTPDATLINGLGRALDGDATALSVINVVQGKRYRFRIVSMSCDPNYIFSIDGHNMTIIEVDGVNHEPLLVDSIQIYAAQRYSVVVTANQPIGNYWLRAQSSSGPTTFDGGLNSAIFRYLGANTTAEPTTNSTISNTLNEVDLHPLDNPGAPGGSNPADVQLVLDIAFANAEFTVNGATFVPPTVPVLLQIISGARLATDLLPSGSVYTLPPNQVIEIIIPGGTTGAPHTFDVVRSAGSDTYNYVNPVRRDVVNTGLSGDNVTIRFETNNAGPWFLHCGLAIVFAEDAATVATESVPGEFKESG